MRAYRNQAGDGGFTRPCTATALTVEDFGFVQADVDILCNLLTHAVARQGSGRQYPALWPTRNRQRPNWPRWFAQASDLVLFEVEYADRDGNSLNGRDRIVVPFVPSCNRPGIPQRRRAIRTII